MTAFIIQTLIATSILLLAVLMFRDVVAKQFGPRAAYLLWLAPALRMVMPPLPAGFWGDLITPVQSVVVVLEGASSLSFQPTSAGEGGSAPTMVALAIWVCGAALFLGWHIARYIVFSRALLVSAQPLFSRDGVHIAISDAVTSPIAFGIFDKTIVVPADFESRFSAVEQRLAIAHEVTHHARRDLWVNLGALVILSLHWFNPIAHIAHRAFRLDQEAACDAIVLRGASADERHAYGSALFKSATGGVPLAMCAMGTASQIKVRLRRIIEDRAMRGGSLFAALLIGGGLVVTASGGAVAETIPDVLAPPAIAVAISPPPPTTAPPPPTTAPPAARPRDITSSRVIKVRTPQRPPVPSAATIAPPAVPQPPAPPAPPSLAKAMCPVGSSQHMTTTTERAEGGEPRSVTVVICRVKSSFDTAAPHGQMAFIRAVIVTQGMIEDSVRAGALSADKGALDREPPLS